MSAALDIGGRLVGDGEPCYVIAEACINHNGDFATALEMIERAAEAGADAIKFQVHYLEHEMLRDVPTSGNFDKPLWNVLEETNLSDDRHTALRDRCVERGIDYLCTAYCREAGDFVASLGVPLLKVGSGETTNIPFLRSLARHGIPLLVSTGMATLEEITDAVAALREAGCRELALLKCTSSYPAPAEEANLRTIGHLASTFNCPVGLSDHTLGIACPVVAVSLGPA